MIHNNKNSLLEAFALALGPGPDVVYSLKMRNPVTGEVRESPTYTDKSIISDLRKEAEKAGWEYVETIIHNLKQKK